MYHFELTPFGRWNAAKEFEKEVERVFKGTPKTEMYTPPCEVVDEEKAYMISLDIPGLRKEDLNLEVKDNNLYVSGERKYEMQEEKNKVLRSEKHYGKFSRVFTLPQNVNPDAIEARFENGVLQIALPKQEKSQTKKIVISDWKKEDVQPDLTS